jgi:hypothetical protein
MVGPAPKLVEQIYTVTFTNTNRLCQYKKKKYYIAVVDGMELKIIKWDGIL